MKQAELRIHDRWSDDPRLLMPFNMFLKVLTHVAPNGLCGEWRIFRGAEGYGEIICSMETSLRTQESIVTDSTELLSVLLSGEEYFDNARIQEVSSGVEFGIVDSTFHFVRGSREVLDKIAAYFTSIQIIEKKD
jgi:hypothetical protein